MKNSITKFLLLGALAILPTLVASSAQAQFNFNSISQDDLDQANKEFSHNFLFSSVSGASSLGSIWGFEVGVLAASSDADKISEIIKRTSPSSDFKNLYGASLLGRLSIPEGFTAELGLLPKVKIQGAEVSNISAALRYSIIELPVAVALRAHYSKTTFSFAQTQGAFTGTIDYDSSIYGIQALVSQNFMVIEPYAGLGYASGKGDINATGTGTLGSIGQSGSAKASSAEILAGLNLHLAFFNLGAEYSRAFDTNKYSGKLSFGF